VYFADGTCDDVLLGNQQILETELAAMPGAELVHSATIILGLRREHE
jgi:hypothetical protein